VLGEIPCALPSSIALPAAPFVEPPFLPAIGFGLEPARGFDNVILALSISACFARASISASSASRILAMTSPRAYLVYCNNPEAGARFFSEAKPMAKNKLKRPWNPTGTTDESTYTDNVKGGVTDSNAGFFHAQNLFNLFGQIFVQMQACATAYGNSALITGSPGATLHDRINNIMAFGQNVLTLQASPSSLNIATNVTNHNNAVRQVLGLLDDCILEANGLVDYLQKSRDHVAAIVSTFDPSP
jgi:hypothetical protein